MTREAICRSAVAVDINQDVTIMAGCAVGETSKNGMVFVQMPSSEVGVIGRVAGAAGPTLPTVDRFVWCL